MKLTARQEEVKADFIRIRGTWGGVWESILLANAEFIAAYLKFSAVPWTKNHLEAKVREFIYIAIDSAATHMYEPGIRQHIRAAFEHGATSQEIMEVIELTSGLGIHAMRLGVPILIEELEAAGKRTGPAGPTEYQKRLKDEFIAGRGYWDESWTEILELDPEIFEAFTEFSSVPKRFGTLDPKIHEFIYIAFDASATHMYESGLRLHTRRALELGATQEEILEVLEIASVIGVHAATTATPILLDEMTRLHA